MVMGALPPDPTKEHLMDTYWFYMLLVHLMGWAGGAIFCN